MVQMFKCSHVQIFNHSVVSVAKGLKRKSLYTDSILNKYVCLSNYDCLLVFVLMKMLPNMFIMTISCKGPDIPSPRVVKSFTVHVMKLALKTH